MDLQQWLCACAGSSPFLRLHVAASRKLNRPRGLAARLAQSLVGGPHLAFAWRPCYTCDREPGKVFPVRCRRSSRVEAVVVPEIPSFPAACLIWRHMYATTSRVVPNFELTDVPFVHRFWKFRTNNSAITEVDE
jgi:hypothetical protein